MEHLKDKGNPQYARPIIEKTYILLDCVSNCFARIVCKVYGLCELHVPVMCC